ncbi:P-II family nitrogen regulator [Thermodesulfovibrionales bacterium]|nr:P-II family nitrogen regulator [Thermodesulfovibrionales bacterium]MCL0067248.1 P-II family nitrogen regulator [Thermodesulfovibrionales bacterium]MCL0106862.1 P-II family nitrogen regulator [Thermodesulfovibrionales bacterium]
MKEVTAIIRMNKMTATKEALDALGFPAMTATKVQGRGKQRGFLNDISIKVDLAVMQDERAKEARWLPKRMVYLVVHDDEVQEVVDTIIKVNQTGNFGDGKIFVTSIEDAARVRTKHRGRAALR